MPFMNYGRPAEATDENMAYAISR